ncbi:MAG: hypothetical protein HY598_05330 [Candidatus Omnitrophica bacterium]|nr:hypothetical protein [Candidatus Omnitrophota bacterium]
MSRHGRGWVFGVSLLAGGCAMGPQQAHQFPSTWPGSQPLSEDAPTVSVGPMKLEVAAAQPPAPSGEGLPTAAVLTALLIKHLHASGVNAVLEQGPEPTAPYTMACSVPQLGYTAQSGYPEQYRYQAELSCTLTDAQAVVWKRSLQQRYETTALLNLLTKIPEQPHQHDRILYKECIVPLWDAMASSVRSALVSRPMLQPSPAAEPSSSAL